MIEATTTTTTKQLATSDSSKLGGDTSNDVCIDSVDLGEYKEGASIEDCDLFKCNEILKWPLVWLHVLLWTNDLARLAFDQVMQTCLEHDTKHKKMAVKRAKGYTRYQTIVTPQ